MLTIDPSWSDKIIVDKMMENSNTINEQAFVSSIVSLNNASITDQSDYTIVPTFFGNTQKLVIIFTDDNAENVNRYVL